MEEWSKQFFQSLEWMARDPERWVQHVAEQFTEASDAWVQATDEWLDRVQQAIEPELDRITEEIAAEINRAVEPLEAAFGAQVDEVVEQMTQVVDPILTNLLMDLDRWFEEVSAPINNTVEPILQDHPACIGCRNYYGQAHGGNMLICAMHPFGPDGEQCPDWESVWPTQDNSGNGSNDGSSNG